MPRRALIGAFKFSHADSAPGCVPLSLDQQNCRRGQRLDAGLRDWEDAAQGFHRRPSRP